MILLLVPGELLAILNGDHRPTMMMNISECLKKVIIVEIMQSGSDVL